MKQKFSSASSGECSPGSIGSQITSHVLMIPNDMTDERIAFGFHDNPYSDIHTKLVLVRVDLLKPIARRDVPCSQDRQESLECRRRPLLVMFG